MLVVVLEKHYVVVVVVVVSVVTVVTVAVVVDWNVVERDSAAN
jgi:hypothetical protein